MTDIQQWRRMIQPARVRTPAVEIEEPEPVQSPTTPRRGLKPKLSSYFTQHTNLSGVSKTDTALEDDWFSTKLPSWSADDPVPSPDANNLIEAIMCRLLSEPYRALDQRFNGMLMQIFESYQNLKEEKQRLLLEAQQEADRRLATEETLHRAKEEWDQEKQDYKAEVKRLELLLAKGSKRGLAEVTLARQDSVLRRGKQRKLSEDEPKETILEFLEKTKRYEDKAWSSQRATMRRRSPSAQMRRLSKTLVTKNSTTSLHVDPPLGKPPLTPSILAQPDYSKRPAIALQPVSEPKTSMSDDTLSTFSCIGDLLPDETADVNLIEAAGTDNDFVAIKRIAHVLAKRRQVDPETVMPKLLELFAAQTVVGEKSSSLPVGLGIDVPRPSSTTVERPPPTRPLQKNPTLKVKASGFFSKLKTSQLHVDTSSASGLNRKFSFEVGDDTEAALSAPAMDTLPPSVRERLIRKSASMSSLEMSYNKASAREPPLSPVAQSPTTSVPPQDWTHSPPENDDAKRPSRIPTPVYKTGSLARPRRERDDSASSLLTAIKHHSGTISQRSGSVSSSSYSSPSASRTDLTQGHNGSEIIQGFSQRSARSNRLLDHTNSLRGNAITAAAAKATNTTTTDVDQEMASILAQRKGNGSRSSTQSRTNSDMGELRKENHRPMGRVPNSGPESNATR